MSIYSKDELNFLLGIKNNKYDIFEKINEKMNEEVKWIFGTILGNLDYSPISTIILISSKGDIIFFNEINNRKSLQKTITELEAINFIYEEIMDEILDDIFYERRFDLENIELNKDDIIIKNLQKFIEKKINKNEQLEIKEFIEKKGIFGINRFLENIIINIDKKLKSKIESYDKDSNIFSKSLPSMSSSNNSSPSSSSSSSSSSNSSSSSSLNSSSELDS